MEKKMNIFLEQIKRGGNLLTNADIEEKVQ